MAGFATVPDAIRAAGRAVGDAVTALRGADCGGPVGGLAAALPGSASSVAAVDYTHSWNVMFGMWCDQASQHAANLASAADHYQATDSGNARELAPGRLGIWGPH